MQLKALVASRDLPFLKKRTQEVAEAVRQSSARLEKAGLSHGDPWAVIVYLLVNDTIDLACCGKCKDPDTIHESHGY